MGKQKRNKQKFCKHKFYLRKQLFKNNTVHIREDCDICGKFTGYVPKTRQNLLKAKGWLEKNEETILLDSLLGLDKLDHIPQLVKMVCGRCRDSCGNCKIRAFCPCHWP